MKILNSPQYFEDTVNYEDEIMFDSLLDYVRDMFNTDKSYFRSDNLEELFRLPDYVKLKLTELINCEHEECILNMSPICVDGNLIYLDMSHLHKIHNGKHKVTKFPNLDDYNESLFVLKISNKEILEIPIELDVYPNLHTLSVPYNRITKLEPYFHEKFPNLQVLHIQGNPIVRHNPYFFSDERYYNLSRVKISPDLNGHIDTNTFNKRGGFNKLYNYDSTSDQGKIFVLSEDISFLFIEFKDCIIDKNLRFKFGNTINLNKLIIDMEGTELLSLSPNFIDNVTKTTGYVELYLINCVIHDIHQNFFVLFEISEIQSINTKYTDGGLLQLIGKMNKINKIQSIYINGTTFLSDIYMIFRKYPSSIGSISLQVLVVDEMFDDLENIIDKIDYNSIKFYDTKNNMVDWFKRLD